jgi:hypothetical protein
MKGLGASVIPVFAFAVYTTITTNKKMDDFFNKDKLKKFK